MTSIDVRDAAGKKSGTVELPAEIFDVKANIPLIHQVVMAQLAAARAGTASTKTRGDVGGGGRKPYRQKGTGRARQGSIRAPQFTGGGVVHGPHPRAYAQRTPKKMMAAALRGALSDRARGGRVHVVDGLLDGDTPSTRRHWPRCAALTERPQVLVVLQRADEHDLAEPAQRPGRAPLRRPAEHLRRAGQRRRGLHPVAYESCWRHGVAARQADESRRNADARPPAPRPTPRRGTRERGRDVSTLTSGPRDVLLAPVVSEKTYGLLDENKYTFLVRPDANKTEIKIAVEKVF